MYSDSLADIVAALSEHGWLALYPPFPPEQISALTERAKSVWQQGGFSRAGIGHGSQQAVNPQIRGDDILWLEAESTGSLAEFQDFMETLRLQVNRELLLGAFDCEMHFAVYPQGHHYQCHIDNFQGRSSRLLTFILYLNPGWQAADGGQLRLYTSGQSGGEYIDILPEAGKLVVFLSERFYHEVLSAARSRLSLTGWLRQRA